MGDVEFVSSQDNQNQHSLPKEDETSKSREPKNVSFFGLFAAADKIDYILMFLGTVGASVHGAALPFFFVQFGHMIDSLGQLSSHSQNMSSQVSQNALCLVYLGLIVFASAWIGVAFWMQTGERQTASLRLRYLQSILRKDISFFDTEARDMNIIFHISSDATLVQDAIGDKIGHALRYLTQALAGFIVGFLSVWQLTLLTMGVVPFLAVAGGAYTIIMSTFSEKAEKAYADASKISEEVISQVRTVYSFVGENRAVEDYSKALKKALKLGNKSGVVKGVGIGCTYWLLFCSWALLLWYSSILVRNGTTNGAKAFITIINAIFSGFAIGQAAPNLAAVAKGRAAAANIMSMIDSDASSFESSDNGVVLPKVAGQIEFSEVCFAYPTRPNMVFEKLSLKIHAGKTFAFVGPSGSGKSTIISLVQRFYDPSSGTIQLDGNDLKTLQLNWLREQMGLVSQEPALFANSIAGNILFGKEDADMYEIIQAAKAANAHSFIQSLPFGYHTQVGEGGTQLSGGQKQRIAIARAVLRNPKILLLDEATSALDTESELIVQQALDRIMLNRTTLVVAHRLSTIRDADTIIVLKDGQVVESGSHIELLENQGEYANLHSLQMTDNMVKSSSVHLTESTSSSSFRDKCNSENHPQGFIPTAELDIQTKDQNTSALTSSIWKLLKLNAPEWPYAVVGSVGAIMAGILAPLFALAITDILTAFYSSDNSYIKKEVQRVAFIFIGGAVIAIPAYFLQHYFHTLMGEHLTSRVRLLMFSAVLSNEVGWFDLDENSTGSLTSALTANATMVRSALADRLSTIVQNLALIVTAVVISFTLSWRIAFVVIASFPLLIGASIAEQMFLKGFGGDYTVAYSRATSLAREAISNIRTVAAFGAEQRISIQYFSELNKPNKQAVLRGHISGFGYGVTQLFGFCSYALGLWYASVLIKHKSSDFGDCMKSFMVLIITALSVAETMALAPDIVKGSQALGPVFRILQRKPAIHPNDPASRLVTDIKGDIEFRDVTFSYPARPDATVFKSLCLKVPAGKSLAVVGQSGSGKSSVISLVLRFYDPTYGSVLIDGCDIRSLNLRSLRLKIGLVQQEPALFSTTIYENIKYGNREASEIEVIDAAKAARAHEFISRMPEGYETHVGDKGIQLSGGQKQRVAIARAILKDPSILLLDEATSALDTESEKLVQEALDKLMQGRTTVLVAHRLSTICDADKIAVLHEGKVVEYGIHEDLMGKSDSVYRQLVHLQQDNSRV